MSRFIAAIFILLLSAVTMSLPAIAEEATPADNVRSWLTKNDLSFEEEEAGSFLLAFKAENTGQVGLRIYFSADFTHFLSPAGFMPKDADVDYYKALIRLTADAPMIKPIIDDDGFLFMAIDLPMGGLNEAEVLNDMALLVDFVDANISTLAPEEGQHGPD